jgi:hypothetical protein
MYNAVGIEHSLAVFLEKEIGARGEAHDADIFRGGDPTDLAQVVELIGSKLTDRVARIKFLDDEKENGGNAPRLHTAGVSLTRRAEQIKQRSVCESEDYHWLIVGDLCMALAAALDHIELLQSQ